MNRKVKRRENEKEIKYLLESEEDRVCWWKGKREEE